MLVLPVKLNQAAALCYINWLEHKIYLASLQRYGLRSLSPKVESQLHESVDHWLETGKIGDVEIGENSKGEGLFATKDIAAGSFICCYEGELLSCREGKRRFCEYPESFGSYLVEFRLKEKQYFLDGTAQRSYGRCINHSVKPNLKGKSKMWNGKPVLYFVASENIKAGSELLWDYGVRDKKSLEIFPWLRS